MSEIRRLVEADFEPLVQIIANAYPGMKIVTPEDKERQRQNQLRVHNEDPLTDFYGLYRDGQLVGVMRLHDFTMNLHGVQVQVGGVGEVAVHLAHKKEKVARDMMAYFLRHCLARGANMALLYPFRPDFYKKMGFGYGPKMSEYRVRPASLPRGPAKDHIRFLNKADKLALLDCYNRYADRTHGMIQKSSFVADLLLESVRTQVVGYERDGELQGYFSFAFRQGKDDNWLINEIYVRELIYETPQVLAELLTFLHTQLDQISHVVFNLHDDDWHHLLLDPRDDSERLIGPVYHQCNTQGVGLMYRVLDVAAIFRQLQAHRFGGPDCRLKLSIRDSFWPQNQGSTVVHLQDGRPQLSPDDDCDVEIGLDIADFSALLMGSVRFEALYRYNLAEISDPQYVAVVDAIFCVPHKPVCTTAF